MPQPLPTVLVTGATGFAGQPLCRRLQADGWHVRAVLRRAGPQASAQEQVVVPDLGEDVDWAPLLRNVEAVVHLAGYAHASRLDPEELRRVNVLGTWRLAEAARDAGVRRLVFISSIKAQGERSHGTALREEDPPQPEDAYGYAKLEAEQGLMERLQAGPTAWTILRPCLLYGPGVKGNLETLLRALAHGAPLPFDSVRNRRSLLSVLGLAKLIALCLRHPRAERRLFLAADSHPLSTPEICRALAAGLGRPPRLFALSPTWLQRMGRLLGQDAAVRRLLGSLVVDSGRAQTELGWRAVQDTRAGLRETGAAYAARQP